LRLTKIHAAVLETMKAAANFKVAVHMVKNTMLMNGSMQSKTQATILG
jgi:hypothetical protein